MTPRERVLVILLAVLLLAEVGLFRWGWGWARVASELLPCGPVRTFL